jgi:ATP-dependent RNA helicase RhlE
MNLKKINIGLKESLIENNFSEANDLQSETFSVIKSGVDCLIIAEDKSGKTTTIVINVIQQLVAEGEESPRALVMVSTKEKVLEIENLFEKLGSHTNLRVYGVHDKSDLEYDKNYISTGIDVLIGTPNRLNDMFSTAGFNVNRLKMFIIDEANTILKLRHEPKIMRISNSITKTQRLIFAETPSERVTQFAEKMLIEPEWFDFVSEFDEDEFDEN